MNNTADLMYEPTGQMDDTVELSPIVVKLKQIHSEVDDDQMAAEVDALVGRMDSLSGLTGECQFSISPKGVDHLTSISDAPPPTAWIWNKVLPL